MPDCFALTRESLVVIRQQAVGERLEPFIQVRGRIWAEDFLAEKTFRGAFTEGTISLELRFVVKLIRGRLVREGGILPTIVEDVAW